MLSVDKSGRFLEDCASTLYGFLRPFGMVKVHQSQAHEEVSKRSRIKNARIVNDDKLSHQYPISRSCA